MPVLCSTITNVSPKGKSKKGVKGKMSTATTLGSHHKWKPGWPATCGYLAVLMYDTLSCFSLDDPLKNKDPHPFHQINVKNWTQISMAVCGLKKNRNLKGDVDHKKKQKKWVVQMKSKTTTSRVPCTLAGRTLLNFMRSTAGHQLTT